MKHSLFLLILLVFLSLLLPVANAEDAAEWMPDTNLRKAVKRSLDLAEDTELTTDDMADLVELKAAARGITDLTGLEHAVNMTTARLAGNDISDITVLSGLTGLEVLRLDSNQITDLTVLSNLTNLRELFIRNNGFTDVDPLLGLTNLRVLRISGNSLQQNAHLLSRLTGLTFIDITIPPPPNSAPVFTEDSSTTRSIAENTEVGVNIGSAISATDADDDTLTYTLGGIDASAFSLDPATGQLQTSDALDYEAKSTYTVTVSVSDGNGGSADISVTINVTDVDENRAPVFSDGSSTTRSIAENTEAGVNIGSAVSATDADDDTLTYTLGGIDASAFDIDTTSGQLQTSEALDHETKSSYTVTVSVSDDNGGSASITVTITITDVVETQQPQAQVAQEPEATEHLILLSHNATVRAGASVRVSATVVDAEDQVVMDATVTFGVSPDDGKASLNPTSALPGPFGAAFTTLTVGSDAATAYTLTATLEDGTSESGTITVQYPPVFTDGDSTTRSIAENTASGVNIGDPVSATDPNGDTLTYRLGGADAASFRIQSATGQLQTSAPLDYETQNTYTLEVTVSDGTLTDTIAVTIPVTNVNEAPVFNEGTATTRSTAENTASGVNIGDPILATDPDGDTLTYTLGGTDATSFRIDSTTGQLQTSAALNYETRTAYTVEVTVSDRDAEVEATAADTELIATITVTINVTDVNEPPVFSEGSATTRSVAENTTSGVNIGDPILAQPAHENTGTSHLDSVAPLTYSLGGTDAASFRIESATGQLQTSALLDYETQNAYTMDVIVSDGPLTATIAVTIHVTDVNEPPVFSEGTATTRSVVENTASGVNIGDPVLATDPDGDTLTYSLGGTDADSFRIESATGQLQTSASLDYETRTTYTVEVNVSDRDVAAPDPETKLMATIAVTIHVTNDNEAPTFNEGSATTRDIREGTASRTNIGEPILAMDPDGDTLMYSLGGTDANTFGINSASGQLQTKAFLDYETQSAYMVIISVFDGNGESATISVTINVTDINENQAIVFSDGSSTTRSIAENTAAGVAIGSAVSATHADNDSLTYTLSGTDAASFNIDSATGQLQTHAPLDYETQSSYAVLVSASDGELPSMIAVMIHVTNVNEPPAFLAETATQGVPRSKTANAAIGAPFTAIDPDANDILTYSLGTDADEASFTIESDTGQLRVGANTTFDYETKNTYTVVVKVTDTGNLSDTITITMNIIMGVCDRTPQVRDAIVAAVPGVTDCHYVTVEHLAAIQTLNIKKKSVTSLKPGDFAGLSAMKSLDLSGNRLWSLPADIFNGLSALEILNLNSNNLSSLPEDVFEDLGALKRLYIMMNRLSRLPADIFDGLEEVKWIWLSSNSLTSLPEDIFDGLSSVEAISLACNSLTGLPAGVFSGLSKLRQIHLDENQLVSLPATVFSGLSELRRLDLEENHLSSLPEGLLSGLSLWMLYLHDNALSSLPDGIFSGLSALRYIDLSGNTVDPLPLTIFLEKVEASKFKAVIPIGAPFDINLPIQITNGSIDDDLTTLTIPSGSVESSPVTVTRTADTTDPVTVNLGTLPSPPNAVSGPQHQGYKLVKSDDLPLTVLETVSAAPSLNGVLIDPTVLRTLEPTALERLLEDLIAENNGSLQYTQAIAVVESILDAMRPEKTQLLVNYPNPFNPETWIPYHLAKPANVQIVIYDTRGRVVRRLDLGYCRAGYYTSKSRAAHWDGRNDFGERVSSGVYFYQLQADNISALRKMLIVK